MATTRAAVFESRAAERRRIREGLTRAGLEVTAAESPESLRGEALVVLGPSVEKVAGVVRAVRKAAPKALVLAARSELQKVAGVDGLLPLPLSPRDLAVRLPELQKLKAAAAPPGARKEAPAPVREVAGNLDPHTHFNTYEHLKDVLLVEVKRARRYSFPVAIAMLGFDPLPVRDPSKVRGPLHGGLALSVRRSLRDTDFPVQYSADRVLLVMPHTDAQGALVVSRRICERVARASLMFEGQELHPTISVGVAAVAGRGRSARWGMSSARRRAAWRRRRPGAATGWSSGSRSRADALPPRPPTGERGASGR